MSYGLLLDQLLKHPAWSENQEQGDMFLLNVILFDVLCISIFSWHSVHIGTESRFVDKSVIDVSLSILF